MGGISWTGLCVACAVAAVDANVTGLATHSGAALKRWRRGVAKGVGGILIEDLTEPPSDS